MLSARARAHTHTHQCYMDTADLVYIWFLREHNTERRTVESNQ